MCLVNEGVKSKEEIQKPVEPNNEMLPTERSLLPMLLFQEQEKTKPSEGMDSLLPIMLLNNADGGNDQAPLHGESFSTKKGSNLKPYTVSA